MGTGKGGAGRTQQTASMGNRKQGSHGTASVLWPFSSWARLVNSADICSDCASATGTMTSFPDLPPSLLGPG